MFNEFQIQCALMAGAVYISNRTETNGIPVPPGWTMAKNAYSQDRTSGFEAVAFVNKGNGLVISFAGTEPTSGMDWITNAGLANGYATAQLEQAAAFYLVTSANDPSKSVSFTGHSLGGGLASLMSVFFNRPAVTFDQAPFAAAASIPVALELISYLSDPARHFNSPVEKSKLKEMLSCLQSFIEQKLVNPLTTPNASNVSDINVAGEVLGALPYSRIGSQTYIPDSGGVALAVDLHSQGLMAAFMISENIEKNGHTLNAATLKLADLLPMIFSEKLFGNPTNSQRVNFIENLVQHQIGYTGGHATTPKNPSATPIAPDNMLSRFDADLWKIAADGGLTAQNKNLSDALIAFAMEKYYKETSSSPKNQLFESITGGIDFLTSSISSNYISTKGHTYFDEYISGLGINGVYKAVIEDFLPIVKKWYIQSGASGLSVTDTSSLNTIMLGGSGDNNLGGGSGRDLLLASLGGTDTLIAGSGETILIAGNGKDKLVSGSGNDSLYGGTGDDEFDISLGSSATVEIDDTVGRGNGELYIGGTQISGGTTLVSINKDKSSIWKGGSDLVYSFSPDPTGPTYPGATAHLFGTLTITGGKLGNEKVLVRDFDMTAAQSTTGYLGLFFKGHVVVSPVEHASNSVTPANGQVTAQGNMTGMTFTSTGDSSKPQTIIVALQSTNPSDYFINTGADLLSLSGGTVTLTIPAGSDSVTVGLVYTGTDAEGQIVQVSSTLQDGGNPVATSPDNSLSISFAAPSTSTTGPLVSGISGALPANPQSNAPQSSATYYQITTGSHVVGSSGNDIIAGIINGYKGPGPDGTFTIQADLSKHNGLINLGAGSGDVLAGNGGQDIILVGGGNNQVYADSVVDLATALSHSQQSNGQHGDLIGVGDGNNTIVGGEGDDAIFYGNGNNLIIGGNGKETIWGGMNVVQANMDWSMVITESVTTVEGGRFGSWTQYSWSPDPKDYYSYSSSTDGVHWGTGNDTIFGGTGDSYIQLTDGNNYVDAGGGNDVIFAGSGNNTIFGGKGNDFISGNGGNNYIDAESGNDIIWAEGGDTTIYGGSGNSDLFAGDGKEDLQTGNVYIEAGSGDTRLSGAAGHDTLIGGSGKDTIVGGSGTEYIQAGSGDTTILGGFGSETIAGGSGVDFIVGTSATDLIYAGDGGTAQARTTVQAGTGDTTIYGGNGYDSLIGGSSNTVIYVGDGGDDATVQLAFAHTGDTTIYGGGGVDQIMGGEASNVLYAGDGGDHTRATSVFGGSGSNTIYGGAGIDVLVGGAGSSVIYAGSGGDDSGAMSVQGGAGDMTVYGGSGVDYIFGGSGKNVLYAGDGGDDVLATQVVAGAGDTTIYGGAGTDQIFGSLGNTTVFAGSGDTGFQAQGGRDVIEVGADSGDVILYGTSQSDTLVLTGAYTSDVTISRGVVDVNSGLGVTTLTLTSGASVTILTGNIGAIQFADGTTASINNLLANSFTTGTVVHSQINATADASTTGINLSGSADLQATANNQNMTLRANAGNDTLVAGTGNDTLVGNIGATTYVVLDGTQTTRIENSNTGDAVQFGSATTAADLTAVAAQDANGNTSVTINDAKGGSVVVAASANGGLDELDLADGSSVSLGALLAQASTGLTAATSATDVTLGDGIQNMTLTGTANLTATGNMLDNVITSNAGNDTLIAGSGDTTLVGGTGQTTYEVNAGYNQVVIAQAGASDKLVFGAGINEADITVETATIGGVSALVLDIDSGNEVIVEGTGVGQVTFGNGDSVTRQQLLTSFVESGTLYANVNVAAGDVNSVDLLGSGISATANAQDDVLRASGANDTLIAGTGNDTLIAGNRNTTYQIANGNQTTTIESSSYSDVLSYGTAVQAADLSVVETLDADGNAVFTVGNAKGGVVNLAASDYGTVNQIKLADGTTTSMSQLLAQATTGITAATSDTDVTLADGIQNMALTGNANITATSNNEAYVVITANSGNDTLIAGWGNDTLVGGSGLDTFVFGDMGQSTVISNSSQGANILLAPGLTFDSVSSQYAGNDLLLVDNDTGSAMRLVGYATNPQAWHIQDAQGNGMPFAFKVGMGQQVLQSGNRQIVMDAALTADQVVVTRNNKDLIVTAGTDSLTLTGWYNDPANLASNTLKFSNGDILSNLQLTSDGLRVDGSAGNMVLTGLPGWDNHLIGGINDTLVGGGGTSRDVFDIGGDTGHEYIEHAGSNSELTDYNGAYGYVYNDVDHSLGMVLGNGGLITFTDVDPANVLGSIGIKTFNGQDAAKAVMYLTENAGDGDVQISGTNLRNTLNGGSGNDTLIGAANDISDQFQAGTGATTMIGGGGAEMFLVNKATDVVIANASATSNDVSVAGNYYTWTSPDNVRSVNAQGYGLTLVGNEQNQTLRIGGNGRNEVITGTGIDTVNVDYTPSGNDVVVINNSLDVLNVPTGYLYAYVAPTILSSVSFSVNALSLIGTGSGDITLSGGNNAIVTGNAGNDRLVSLNNATLISGSGLDTLIGSSAGNNTFTITRSDDVVIAQSSASGNVLNLKYNNSTYVEDEVFTALTATGDNLRITGNSRSQTITASGANDTLVAGSAADTLVGGGLWAANQITGLDSASYVFVVNNTADVVRALTNNNAYSPVLNTIQTSVNYTAAANVQTMQATAAGLTLTANATGTRLVAADGGATTLVGGAGNDTFVLHQATDVIVTSAGAGNDTEEVAMSATLAANVTNLVGTGTAAITLAGNSGTHTITANAGADRLVAGSGNATLISGTGIDTLVSGSGNDVFVINNSADVITAASVNANNVVQTNVNYVLPANLLNLTAIGDDALVLTGNGQAATLTANDGNDTLISGTGINTLVGGIGVNTFVINNSADVINASASKTTSTVQTSVSYAINTNLTTLTGIGSNGITLTGSSTATLKTRIVANNAGDTLVAGAGITTLVGGAGNDTFVVNSTTDVITEAAGAGTDTEVTSVSLTVAANVENLTGSGTAALTLTGNTLNNVITANSGNDTLISGTGIDTLVAGSGNDTFVIKNSADTIVAASVNAANVVQTSVNFVLPANLLNLTATGTTAITLTGNNLADTLTANSANDTLISGTGIDTLVGGAGNVTFVVNNSSDVISVSAAKTGNVVQSSVNYTLGTNLQVLTGIGSADLTLTGNTLADKITANNGNDTLVAGTGLATLVGGTGADVFVINNASDVVTAQSTAALNTVQSSVSYIAAANVTDLFLTGTTALTATGNTGTNLIIGNTGADTLVAGTGTAVLQASGSAANTLRDTGGKGALLAGGGNDTMTGGTGVSFFAAGAGADVITLGAGAAVVDFNHNDGSIAITANTTNHSNVLSLGGGIAYADLTFSKSGNNLILHTGGTGAITFTNWYSGTTNQDFSTLQVLEQAATTYSAGSTNALYNNKVEEFNFTALVTAFNSAVAANPSLTSWSLMNSMLSAHLTSSSDTAAFGGDLAYYDGLNSKLTGLDLAAAASTLSNTSFGKSTQTIDTWTGVSASNNRLH